MRIAVVVAGMAASEGEWYMPVVEHYLKALAVSNEVTVFTIHYPLSDIPYALCEIKKQRQHPIEKTEHQC
ncbi:MAG: hypothetical protein L0154_30680 [Chloroflexi bacterium]|nr:hypothetical protein [Chloroflexota bacterium]